MFPIRYKFLGIIVALIVVTMLAYLVLAVSLFEGDKEAYIYETNASLVEAIATETETLVEGVTKTMRTVADLGSGAGGAVDAERRALVERLFAADEDLVELVVLGPGGRETLTLVNDAFLDLNSLDRSTLARVRGELRVTPAEMKPGKLYLQNATLPGGVPMISMGVRLGLAGTPGDQVVLGQVKQDRLLKIFSRSQTYTVFLIDGYGNLLAHPDLALVAARENVADPAFIEQILTQPFKTGAKEFTAPDGSRWLTSFSKLGIGDLTVVSRISREKAFVATQRLVQKSVLFALALVLMSIMVGVAFTKSLTRPINRLFEATRRIAGGDFGVRVEQSTRDEIGALTSSFNAMSGQIVTLMTQVADKARMEKELETARVVQENLFPEAQAKDQAFDLAGFYTPASECGGDWWGYFRVGGSLAVLIGDATGHGVPAALITAAAQSCCTTIQQIHARWPSYKITPAGIMSHLNAAVHLAAKGGMNMTFFIAMIDLETGRLTYCNASHELPVIVRGSDSTQVEMLTGDPDTVLGESLKTSYHEHTFDLEPGDTVVWYTDGLIEGRNAEETEWGERRFLKALKKNAALEASALRDELIGEARKFYGTTPADDDITYIVVRWQKASEMQKAG